MQTALTPFTVFLALAVAALLPLAASRDPRRSDLLIASGFAALVLIASSALAASGILRDFSKFPPPMMRLLLVLTVCTVVLALSPIGGRIAQAVPLWALVGFQSFRILVELILWALFRGGRIPVQMTFEGYNFDVLTGLSALTLGALLRGRALPRSLLWAWNLAGLATLLNIVVIAVLSMPTPISMFHSGPPNTLVAEFPFVWIPGVFVQAALFGHLLTFRALLRPRPVERVVREE